MCVCVCVCVCVVAYLFGMHFLVGVLGHNQRRRDDLFECRNFIDLLNIERAMTRHLAHSFGTTRLGIAKGRKDGLVVDVVILGTEDLLDRGLGLLTE